MPPPLRPCLAVSLVREAGGALECEDPQGLGSIETAATAARTTTSQVRILARCIPDFYPTGGG